MWRSAAALSNKSDVLCTRRAQRCTICNKRPSVPCILVVEGRPTPVVHVRELSGVPGACWSFVSPSTRFVLSNGGRAPSRIRRPGGAIRPWDDRDHAQAVTKGWHWNKPTTNRYVYSTPGTAAGEDDGGGGGPRPCGTSMRYCHADTPRS